MKKFAMYIDVLKYKVKSVYSRKCSFSSIIYNSVIDQTATIKSKTRFYDSRIGRYSYIARNSLIQNTSIGNFCSISDNCNIGMPSHPTDFLSTSPVFLSGGNPLRKHFSEIDYENCPRTTIGNDVWIGASAKIKSGVSIGNGAIIAAGAVVTHDVPPYAIVGGIPAKIIRYRFNSAIINDLQAIRWWEYSDDDLACISPYVADVNKFIESYKKGK